MTYLEYVAQGSLSTAQAQVSACKSLDDYSPLVFQTWYQRQAQGSGPRRDYPPAYCHQTCATVGPDGLLSLACIACDVVPLVRPTHGHSQLSWRGKATVDSTQSQAIAAGPNGHVWRKSWSITS